MSLVIEAELIKRRLVLLSIFISLFSFDGQAFLSEMKDAITSLIPMSTNAPYQIMCSHEPCACLKSDQQIKTLNGDQKGIEKAMCEAMRDSQMCKQAEEALLTTNNIFQYSAAQAKAAMRTCDDSKDDIFGGGFFSVSSWKKTAWTVGGCYAQVAESLYAFVEFISSVLWGFGKDVGRKMTGYENIDKCLMPGEGKNKGTKPVTVSGGECSMYEQLKAQGGAFWATEMAKIEKDKKKPYEEFTPAEKTAAYWALAKSAFMALGKMIHKHSGTLGCYKNDERVVRTCRLIADFIVPPNAFFGLGGMAARQIRLASIMKKNGIPIIQRNWKAAGQSLNHATAGIRKGLFDTAGNLLTKGKRKEALRSFGNLHNPFRGKGSIEKELAFFKKHPTKKTPDGKPKIILRHYPTNVSKGKLMRDLNGDIRLAMKLRGADRYKALLRIERKYKDAMKAVSDATATRGKNGEIIKRAIPSSVREVPVWIHSVKRIGNFSAADKITSQIAKEYQKQGLTLSLKDYGAIRRTVRRTPAGEPIDLSKSYQLSRGKSAGGREAVLVQQIKLSKEYRGVSTVEINGVAIAEKTTGTVGKPGQILEGMSDSAQKKLIATARISQAKAIKGLRGSKKLSENAKLIDQALEKSVRAGEDFSKYLLVAAERTGKKNLIHYARVTSSAAKTARKLSKNDVKAAESFLKEFQKAQKEFVKQINKGKDQGAARDLLGARFERLKMMANAHRKGEASPFLSKTDDIHAQFSQVNKDISMAAIRNARRTSDAERLVAIKKQKVTHKGKTGTFEKIFGDEADKMAKRVLQAHKEVKCAFGSCSKSELRAKMRIMTGNLAKKSGEKKVKLKGDNVPIQIAGDMIRFGHAGDVFVGTSVRLGKSGRISGKLPLGSTIKLKPDGTIEHLISKTASVSDDLLRFNFKVGKNGKIKGNFPRGTKVTRRPDGTVIVKFTDPTRVKSKGRVLAVNNKIQSFWNYLRNPLGSAGESGLRKNFVERVKNFAPRRPLWTKATRKKSKKPIAVKKIEKRYKSAPDELAKTEILMEGLSNIARGLGGTEKARGVAFENLRSMAKSKVIGKDIKRLVPGIKKWVKETPAGQEIPKRYAKKLDKRIKNFKESKPPKIVERNVNKKAEAKTLAKPRPEPKAKELVTAKPSKKKVDAKSKKVDEVKAVKPGKSVGRKAFEKKDFFKGVNGLGAKVAGSNYVLKGNLKRTVSDSYHVVEGQVKGSAARFHYSVDDLFTPKTPQSKASSLVRRSADNHVQFRSGNPTFKFGNDYFLTPGAMRAFFDNTLKFPKKNPVTSSIKKGDVKEFLIISNGKAFRGKVDDLKFEDGFMIIKTKKGETLRIAQDSTMDAALVHMKDGAMVIRTPKHFEVEGGFAFGRRAPGKGSATRKAGLDDIVRTANAKTGVLARVGDLFNKLPGKRIRAFIGGKWQSGRLVSKGGVRYFVTDARKWIRLGANLMVGAALMSKYGLVYGKGQVVKTETKPTKEEGPAKEEGPGDDEFTPDREPANTDSETTIPLGPDNKYFAPNQEVKRVYPSPFTDQVIGTGGLW